MTRIRYIEPMSITNNFEEKRYEVDENGALAYINYRIEGNTIFLEHTFVPDELRGNRLAVKMADAVFEDIRKNGYKVVSECSYINVYMKRKGIEE